MERRKRACRRKPPAARTGRVQARARTGRRCGEGLRTAERHHAPNTAKHTEYETLKSHQQKAQFGRHWANQELHNLKQQETLPKQPRRGQGVGRGRVFCCDGGEVRLLLRHQRRDPTRECLRWENRWSTEVAPKSISWCSAGVVARYTVTFRFDKCSRSLRRSILAPKAFEV